MGVGVGVCVWGFVERGVSVWVCVHACVHMYVCVTACVSGDGRLTGRGRSARGKGVWRENLWVPWALGWSGRLRTGLHAAHCLELLGRGACWLSHSVKQKHLCWMYSHTNTHTHTHTHNRHSLQARAVGKREGERGGWRQPNRRSRKKWRSLWRS